MDMPIQLEEIHTAVRLIPRDLIRQYGSVDGLQELFRESGRRGFRGSGVEKQDGIAIANREKFLMVLGGPGIGKSTFLRKVGLEALKSKDVDHTGRPKSQYQPDCVPVFLPLQKFKSTERTIEQRIAEEFATCGFPEPDAVTQALLKKGRLLVLLSPGLCRRQGTGANAAAANAAVWRV
jgi:predicted NACHT family NTPase